LRMTRVVVCLTSTQARVGHVWKAIVSLRCQTRLPTEIRLYLGPTCLAPASDGMLKVHRVPVDRGPITKLSAVADPSLPDDTIIITTDDDVVCCPDWLKMLLVGAALHPEAAVGLSGWNAKKLISGTATTIEEAFDRPRPPSTCDVLEGWAGVAYRKGFFNGTDVLNPPSYAKWVDDVWISTCLKKAGIPRRVVGFPQSYDALNLPGLHDRSDFIALNRHAATIGFPQP